MESRARSAERRFPAGVRLDPVDDGVRRRVPGPPVRDGHREPLSLLDGHGRGFQVQERGQRGIQADAEGALGDEGPEHAVAGVQQLLAPAEGQTFPVLGDVVVDEQDPVVIVLEAVASVYIVSVILGRRDPIDVPVVELAVKGAVVGEVTDLGDCVESVDGSIPGWFAGIAACTLTVTGECDPVHGNVAGARGYVSFVKGGQISFDADADCVVSVVWIRPRTDARGDIRRQETYPLASGAAYVVVVANRAPRRTSAKRGIIGGRSLSQLVDCSGGRKKEWVERRL